MFSYSGHQNIRKSHLICLPRPLIMILAFGVNFGPLRAKISQIAWGTPTFYCTPRLYLPIGIQKYTYFCWCIFFHFWLGSKSQWRPVLSKHIWQKQLGSILSKPPSKYMGEFFDVIVQMRNDVKVEIELWIWSALITLCCGLHKLTMHDCVQPLPS